MATPKTDKYYRVIVILAKGCTILTKAMLTKVVREVRPSRYHLPNLNEFVSENRHGLEYDNGERRNIPEQHQELLFPTSGDAVELEKWDLSLTINVMLDVCELPRVVIMDLKRLKKIRNRIFHNPDADLSDEKYDAYMEDLKIIIKRCLEWIGDKRLTKKINEIIHAVDYEEDYIKRNQEFLDTCRRLESEISKQQKENKTYLKRISDGSKINIDVDGPISKQKQRDVCQQLISQIKSGLQQISLAKDDQDKVESVMENAMKSMLGSSELTSVKEECVALYVQCVSVEELFRLWRRCVKGELTELLKPVERSIREGPGLEDVELKISLSENEFVECFFLIVRDIFLELSDDPAKQHCFNNELLSCMNPENSPTEFADNLSAFIEPDVDVDSGKDIDHIATDQRSQNSPRQFKTVLTQ